MAVPQRVPSGGKTGQVVAGSSTVVRAPSRLHPQAKRERTENGGWRPVVNQYAAPLQQPKQNKAKKAIGAAIKTIKKAKAVAKAVPLTISLLIPAAAHMVLAVALIGILGYLDTGLIAWATKNFEILDTTAEVAVGTLYILIAALNVLMFLYVMFVYTFSLVKVYTPASLIILAICLAGVLVPPATLIPWILIYVWAVALSQ